MTTIELARWQFAITTLFHYIFVPLSIGMAFYVAVLQTRWHRSGLDVDLRAVRYWGKFMLITFAVGVVTGIWQEFQFGMGWSAYSKYVGDIFGAPLAIEGLAAFFLESTFIGLWLFGWGRLPRRVHLATIWAVAIGTILSAGFILVANSWMQNPVGYEVVGGRAELTDFGTLFTNPVFIWAWPHTIFAALATGAMVVVGISAWHVRRGNETVLFGRSLRVGLVIVAVGGMGAVLVGDTFGRVMLEKQPMKMAAGEGLFDTEAPAAFSLFATGTWDANPGELTRNIKVPYVLSLLSTLTPTGKVEGINQIQARYEKQYGAGNYVPIVGITYWSWRTMIYLGSTTLLIALAGLWFMRRRTLDSSPRFLRLLLFAIPLPFLANFGGWVFTEVGRQPWAVQGLLRTDDAVSPHVSTAEFVISLSVLSALYAVMLAVSFWLFRREAQHDPKPLRDPSAEANETPDLELAY